LGYVKLDPVMDAFYRKQWPGNHQDFPEPIEKLRKLFLETNALHEKNHTVNGNDEVAARLAELILGPRLYYTLANIFLMARMKGQENDPETLACRLILEKLARLTKSNVEGLHKILLSSNMTEMTIRSLSLRIYVEQRQQSFFGDPILIKAAKFFGIENPELEQLMRQDSDLVTVITTNNRNALQKALEENQVDQKVINAFVHENIEELTKDDHTVTLEDRDAFIRLVRGDSNEIIRRFGSLMNEKLPVYLIKTYTNETDRSVKRTELSKLILDGIALYNALRKELGLPGDLEIIQQQMIGQEDQKSGDNAQITENKFVPSKRRFLKAVGAAVGLNALAQIPIFAQQINAPPLLIVPKYTKSRYRSISDFENRLPITARDAKIALRDLRAFLPKRKPVVFLNGFPLIQDDEKIQHDKANQILKKYGVLLFPEWNGHEYQPEGYAIVRPSELFKNVSLAVSFKDESASREKAYLEGQTNKKIGIVDLNNVERTLVEIQNWFLGYFKLDPVMDVFYRKQWPRNNQGIPEPLENLRRYLIEMNALHEENHTVNGTDEVAGILAPLILGPRIYFTLGDIFNTAQKGEVGEPHTLACQLILKEMARLTISTNEALPGNLTSNDMTPMKIRSLALLIYIEYMKQSFFNDPSLMKAAQVFGISTIDLKQLINQDLEISRTISRDALQKALEETKVDPKIINASVHENIEELIRDVNTVNLTDRDAFIRLVQRDPNEAIRRFKSLINDKLPIYLIKTYPDETDRSVKRTELSKLLLDGITLFNALRKELGLPGDIKISTPLPDRLPDRAMRSGRRQLEVWAMAGRKVPSNPAMAMPSKGGIDLTPANMNVQVKTGSPTETFGDDKRSNWNDSRSNGIGKGIQFHIDPAMLAQLQNAPGFVPVIIRVRPLKSLTEFLQA